MFVPVSSDLGAVSIVPVCAKVHFVVYILHERLRILRRFDSFGTVCAIQTNEVLLNKNFCDPA